MATPKIPVEFIQKAIEYIDANGVPKANRSTQYSLVIDGKEYPPKYVIAVARYLKDGGDITTDGYNAVEAKKYFESKQYQIISKQIKYVLTITADNVESTDDRFDINDLNHAEVYKPLDAYFIDENGAKIKRNYAKSENKISNQTLPRIAFQLYEKEISELSVEEKEDFPICRYTADGDIKRGIYPSQKIYAEKTGIKGWEYMVYKYGEGREFIIYSWNMFSSILFLQECLKRFAKPGEKFVLEYRDKADPEDLKLDVAIEEKLVEDIKEYKNKYSKVLVESKNIIFRGAPGTGKSYLAKQIAADIVSNGYEDNYTNLTPEQKQQVEFVQFHPGYDYSDFVEGLRPVINDDQSMSFKLQDGVFKRFVDKARVNFENSKKDIAVISAEETALARVEEFLQSAQFEETAFNTLTNNKFYISDYDEKYVTVSIPDNNIVKSLKINKQDICKLIISGEEFNQVKDLTGILNRNYRAQVDSYILALYKQIMATNIAATVTVEKSELKKYVFIIDEINRGEISKIFGELFFTVDPGYRGESGSVATQYSNLHENPDERFYIPDNVYIIGTMNDIDRSVDSFDFAMRRRFRFIEIKPDEQLEMLSGENGLNEGIREEAISRMEALNNAIVSIEDLNENYQIGGAYFLKLKTLSFDELWTDCLEPLLQDYVRGMYGEKEYMDKFAKAYGISVNGEKVDESIQD